MLIFSPVVHPWYIGWLIILLPVAPRPSGIFYAALGSLTAITIMNYQLYGVWKEYSPALIAEYLPVIVLLVRELIFDGREINVKN
jgi:hypothetical protein